MKYDTVKQAAEGALQAATNCISNGSGNKYSSSDKTGYSSISAQLNDANVTDIRRNKQIYQKMAIMDLKSGNCFEYALMAWDHLKSNCFKCSIVQLTHPGDHVFVIVGGSLDDLRNSNSNSASKINDWSRDDLYICDPWLGLACAAKDYCSNVAQTLDTWSKSGVKVSYNGNWMDPAADKYCLQFYNSGVVACDVSSYMLNLKPKLK